MYGSGVMCSRMRQGVWISLQWVVWGLQGHEGCNSKGYASVWHGICKARGLL